MRRRVAVGAVLLAFLAFAACGDDDGDDAAQPDTPSTLRVELFFGPPGEQQDCAAVATVSREVGNADPLRATLNALLEGPTPAETAAGYTSWFSPNTDGMLRSVVVEDGVAHVDFADFRSVIPNASSSCGSAALLAQLDATVGQFVEVEQAVYSFEGDVDAFYEFLQLGAPEGYGSARE